MAYEAAYTALAKVPFPGDRNIVALSKFAQSHLDVFRQCWSPNIVSAPSEQDLHKSSEEIAEIEKNLGVNKQTAAYVFQNTKSLNQNQLEADQAAFLLSERKHLIKFLANLLSSTEQDERSPLATNFMPDLLLDGRLFVKIFKAIAAPEHSQVAFELIDLVYSCLFSVIPDNSSLIAEWFAIAVIPTNFFANFPKKTKALALLTTVQFLDVHQTFSLDSGAYYNLEDQLLALAKVFEHAECPAPLSLVWALVLHKLARVQLHSPSKSVSGLIKHLGVKSHTFDFYIKDLIKRATQGAAVDELIAILDHLPQHIQYTQSVTDVVQELVGLCYLTSSLANIVARLLEPFPSLGVDFFENEKVMTTLQLAKSKIPIHLDSFVTLARVFPDKNALVSDMECFIDTIEESVLTMESNDTVSAKSDLHVFPARQGDGSGGILVQRGTIGTLLGPPREGSALVMWSFKYNGWTFLGRALENAESKREWDPVMLNVIQLVTSLALDQSTTDKTLEAVLGALSSGLSCGDFIVLVSSYLETALSSPKYLTTCIAIMDLLTALLGTCAFNRIWRVLVNGVYSSMGLMSRILQSSQLFSENYEFSLSLNRLCKALVENNDVSQQAQTCCLVDGVRHLLDVFESCIYWSYTGSQNASAIVDGIITTLRLALSYGQPKELHTLICEELLSSRRARRRAIQPLLEIIENLTGQYELDLANEEYLVHALDFCALLIRFRQNKEGSHSELQHQLYSRSSNLALLYARHSSLRPYILNVIDALIESGGESPPSLLAYIGSEASDMLMSSLINTVEDNLESDITLERVFGFFRSVAVSKQEGLFILLVSGEDLRAETGKKTAKSLYRTLEQKAVNESGLLNPKTLSALFSALAVGNVSNRDTDTRTILPTNSGLMSVLFDYIGSYPGSARMGSSETDCYKVLAVANAVKVLCGQVYHMDKNSPVLSNFFKNKTVVDMTALLFSLNGFTLELHREIHDQLQGLGHQLTIPQPEHSDMDPNYGSSFVYNDEVLDIIFRKNEKWPLLRSKTRSANWNLSFMDAQIRLIHEWKRMCVILSSSFASQLGQDLGQIAYVSLQSIGAYDLEIPYFLASVEDRVDATFYIVNSLVQSETQSSDMKLMELALGLFAHSNVGLPASVENGTPTRAYKQLQKILALCFESFEATDESSLDFATKVLCSVCVENVCCIVGACGRTPPESISEDLLSILLILRKGLSLIEGSPLHYEQVQNCILVNGTERYVYRLFTYSMELQGGACKTSLSQLSLYYILELLGNASMAEYFVNRGLFTVLLEAPISQRIQKGEITASQEPDVHATWTSGILTMMVVVARVLGPKIKHEVLLMVERFQRQIDSCLLQWCTASGEISTALIFETYLINCVSRFLGSSKTVFEKDDLLRAIDHLKNHRKYLATRISDDGKLDSVMEELSFLREAVQ